MFTAGTDTKHYADIAEAMYRFMPAVQSQADLAGVHGYDERISVENVHRCCLFYERLLASL
jgi:carboxypeptidase PM20D1